MPRRGAITYEGLPLSRGGAHRLRTRGFAAGLNALQSFVAAVSLETRPINLCVEVLEGEGVPKEISLLLRAELDERYAKTRVRMIGAYRGHQWDIDPGSLVQIVERIAEAGPIPETKYAGSMVVIHAMWNLLLFDTRTRQALPYQRKEDHLGWEIGPRSYLGCSSLYARIAEATSAHLFLSLPFEDITEEAKRIAADIQTSFPARLSAKHWKMWTLTKAQTGYVGRKTAALC
jgi:hypothetical protein